ncbi:MAG: alpha/beta hydrolase [Thermodesulfobacteriota bacterium]
MGALWVVAAGLASLLGGMWLFQEKLVYFPSPSLDATPADVGLPFRDVRFAAADGVALHGWYVPADAPRGTVLFFHGNAGNISHRLDTLRLVRGLGLNIFIFDYRGYGRSEGRTTEQGTYADARGAWDWLMAQAGEDPARVVLWGRSLGGAVAAHLAAGLDEPPAALIMESTFTSLPDMGAVAYPFLPVRLIARMRYPVAEDLARVRCPVLVAHSPQDEIVPFRFGERLYEVAPEPKRFLRLRGDHNGGWMATGKEYARAVDAFLRDCLGRRLSQPSG